MSYLEYLLGFYDKLFETKTSIDLVDNPNMAFVKVGVHKEVYDFHIESNFDTLHQYFFEQIASKIETKLVDDESELLFFVSLLLHIGKLRDSNSLVSFEKVWVLNNAGNLRNFYRCNLKIRLGEVREEFETISEFYDSVKEGFLIMVSKKYHDKYVAEKELF